MIKQKCRPFSVGLAAVIFSIFLTSPSQAQEASCQTVTDSLRALLSNQACKQISDCALIQLSQAFGCTQAINKSFLAQMTELHVEYEKLCGPEHSNCPNNHKRLLCRKGRCEAKVYQKHRRRSN
jgi:hypothetical protein